MGGSEQWCAGKGLVGLLFDNGKIKKQFKPNFFPLNLRQNLTPHILTSSAITYTGCSSHYLLMTSPCSNAKPTKNGVNVLLDDGGIMRATHTSKLPIKALPYAGRQAHLFPALSSGALLSVGQLLCDHGCQANFNASTVNIIKNARLFYKAYSTQPMACG
jgi:hypothetical protein